TDRARRQPPELGTSGQFGLASSPTPMIRLVACPGGRHGERRTPLTELRPDALPGTDLRSTSAWRVVMGGRRQTRAGTPKVRWRYSFACTGWKSRRLV